MSEFVFDQPVEDQFQDEFQAILTPGRIQMKKRKSSLDEAIRLKTPIKPKPFSLVDRKENDHNTNIQSFEPPSANKPKRLSVLTPNAKATLELFPLETDMDEDNGMNGNGFQALKRRKSSLGAAIRIQQTPTKRIAQTSSNLFDTKENNNAQDSNIPSSFEITEVPFSPRPDLSKKRKGSLGEAVRIKATTTPVKKPATTRITTRQSSSVVDKRPKTTTVNKPVSKPTTTKSKEPTAATKQQPQPKRGSVLTPNAKVALQEEQLEQQKFEMLNECNLTIEATTNNNNHGHNWKASDFTVGKPLGKGKFGNVYFARQKGGSNLPIALKVLFKSQMKHEQVILMLKREIEIQYELKHENINQLYSYFQDSKHVYLMLEYAENGEFYKYLQNSYRTNQIITEDHCKNFIYQITSALSFIHSRHIYHRDIKPENILMGVKGKLILADFGSAVRAPPPSESNRFTICGTPEYLSPEMILCLGHDSSLDCWSLGILMYEILYGR
jgi:hypothetical protein